MNTIIKLFLTVFTLLNFSNCFTSVGPGEVGLRWNPFTNGLEKEVLGSKLYGYWPWNNVYKYSIQWASYSEKVDILTQDDLSVIVTANIILRPTPSKIYDLQMDTGPEYYTKVVRPEFRTSVRNILSSFTMIQISKKTPNISNEIKATVIDKLKGKHLDIDDVIIDDIEYSKPILRAIETKLTKEQEQHQMVFEINIAKRDAEITIIKAQAQARANVIEAEGQAKAQEIINKQLTTKYIQLKAVENPNNRMMILPSGRDGLPVIINAPQEK